LGRTARRVRRSLLDQPAYHDLERRLGDRCGAINGRRSSGRRSLRRRLRVVVAVAISELMRYYADDATRFEVLNLTLRDLTAVRCVSTPDWQGGESFGMVELV
jgi:hypothetical protein